MFWVFYGLPIVHPNSLLVVTINGIGLILEAIYLVIFLVYAPRQGRLKVSKILAAEVSFMTVVVVVVLLTAHTHEKRSLIVGILCIIFGTCMYASPLSVMIPNGLGALFGLAQLILYACYYKSTPKAGTKAEVELPTAPTFKNIIKRKAVEQYQPFPELARLLKCMLGVLYGLPIVHPNSRLLLTSNAIGLFLQAVYLTIYLIYAAREIRVAHTHEMRSLIVGIPFVVFGSCMYAAPIAFLIPNGLGVLFDLAPLILYACYCKSTPKAEVELPTTTNL
ncbi:hypothetical protein GW17_00002904 [Ensete ventricosum]|nr:hypothetical protein GW17_00002904 [Ensete ventricosum]